MKTMHETGPAVDAEESLSPRNTTHGGHRRFVPVAVVAFAFCMSCLVSLLSAYFVMQAVSMLPPHYEPYNIYATTLYMAGYGERGQSLLLNITSDSSDSMTAGLQPLDQLSKPGGPCPIDGGGHIPIVHMPADVQLTDELNRPHGYVGIDPATGRMPDGSVDDTFLRRNRADVPGGFAVMGADTNVRNEDLPPEVVWREDKGNTYPPLGPDGTVPYQYLPANLARAMVFVGVWDPLNNLPYLRDGQGERGHFYIALRKGDSVVDGNRGWNGGESIVFNGTQWLKIGPLSTVTSVQGRDGVVTLALDDITDVEITQPKSGVIMSRNGKWTNEPVRRSSSFIGRLAATQSIAQGSNYVLVTAWASQGYYTVSTTGFYMITVNVPISGFHSTITYAAIKVNDNFVMAQAQNWASCPVSDARCMRVLEVEAAVPLSGGDVVSVWVNPGSRGGAGVVDILGTVSVTDDITPPKSTTATGLFSVVRIDTFF